MNTDGVWKLKNSYNSCYESATYRHMKFRFKKKKRKEKRKVGLHMKRYRMYDAYKENVRNMLQ